MKILKLGVHNPATSQDDIAIVENDDDAIVVGADSYTELTFTDEGGSKQAANVELDLGAVDPVVSGGSPIGTPIVPARIEIVDSYETTKNGALRILVKVNLPYYGIDAAAYAEGAAQFNTGRSKHQLTAHVVFTLPKEWVEDIKGTKAGAAGQKLAARQLELAIGLLLQLIGDPKRQSQKGVGLGGAFADSLSMAHVYQDSSEGVTPVGLKTGAALTGTSVYHRSPGYNVTRSTLGGTDSVIERVKPDDEVILVGDYQNMFWRAVNNMRPLDREGTYGQKAFGTFV